MAAAALFFVILSLLVKNSASNQCKEGWVYNNGSCYGYGKTPTSWFEAATACSLMNTTLVEIETSAENDFVKLLLKNKQVVTAWIGGTDMFNEGNWIWVTSRLHIYPFSDWYTGRPTDGAAPGYDCLAAASSFQYQWFDGICSSVINFLCETHSLETVVG